MASLTPSSSDLDVNATSRDTNAVPYVERQTDEKERVYTRSWLYSKRLGESVDPETDILNKLKAAQAYRASFAASSISNSGAGPSSRDGQQHRDRRGSSGPRSGRSGSGSSNPLNPSGSYPNLSTGASVGSSSGANNNNGGNKSRGSSGSGSFLSQPSLPSSSSPSSGANAAKSTSNASTNATTTYLPGMGPQNVATNAAGGPFSNDSRDSSPITFKGRESSHTSFRHPSMTGSGSSGSLNAGAGVGGASFSSSPSSGGSYMSLMGPRFMLSKSTMDPSARMRQELVGLLNKLTIDKFDSLSSQISKKFETIENAELFTECVKILHNKALQEHSFCAMYAILAKMLDRIYSFETSVESPSSTSSTQKSTALSSSPSSRTAPIPMPGTSSSSSRISQIKTDAPTSSPSSGSLAIADPTYFRSTSPLRQQGSTGGDNTSNIYFGTPPTAGISHMTSGSPYTSSSPLQVPVSSHSSSNLASNNSSGTLSSSPSSSSSSMTGIAKPRQVGMFRKLLLNNCYYVWQEAMEGGAVLIGEDESKIKARRRIMGNMVFMGELYKQGLMPIRVLRSSSEGLIAHIKENSSLSAKPQHALVEAHCIMLNHLISTVGECLDRDKSTKPMLESYMEALKNFASDKGFQLRVRLLLRDVIDDRLNDWRPRRRYEGPMKLEDLKELHEADLINPVLLASVSDERVYAPSSEFLDKSKSQQSNASSQQGSHQQGQQQERQSISPAKGGRGGNKERSGSGSTRGNLQNRRSGSSGASTATMPFGAIKEPTGYSTAAASPSSSSNNLSTQQATHQQQQGNATSPAHITITLSNSQGSKNSEIQTPETSKSSDYESSPNRETQFPREIVVAALEDFDEIEKLSSYLQKSSQDRSIFISRLLSWILDCSRSQQAKLVSFLKVLVSRSSISHGDITEGFSQIVRTLDDLTMDVPQAPLLLGKWVSLLVSPKYALLSPSQRDAIISQCPQRFSTKFTSEANVIHHDQD